MPASFTILDLPDNTTNPPVAGTYLETGGPEGSRKIPATPAGLGAAPAPESTDTGAGYSNFACWGDSLSANTGGVGYPRQLQAQSLFTAYEGGVGGETSTQIKTRFLAAPARLNDNIVIWAGRNNLNAPATVKADIAAMVDAIPHTRFLILGLVNQSTEVAGSAPHTDIVALNADLAALYGDHFFDIRAWLIASGLADAGIAPTPTDLADIAADCTPTSLRSDNLHWNTAGGGAIARQVLRIFAAQIAPLADAEAITFASLFDLMGYNGGSRARLAGLLNISVSGLTNARTITVPDIDGTPLYRTHTVSVAGDDYLTFINSNTAGVEQLRLGETVASALNVGWRGSTAGNFGALRAGSGFIFTGGNGFALLNTNSASISIGTGAGLGFTPQLWVTTAGLRIGSETGPVVSASAAAPAAANPNGSIHLCSDAGADGGLWHRKGGVWVQL
jgi:hypothetical protein